MPRVKRRHVPGAVVHVITRFVNGIHVMDEVDGAREQYLARLSCAVGASDWKLCWYGLMGTHTHLGLVCGEDPLDAWIRRLHSGWAGWVNRRGRASGLAKRGPIIADRPMTILVPNHRAKYVGAYIHNNPVRAKVVIVADASSWTSHRAYLGIEPALPGLDVATGLAFYDCTPSAEGRRRFKEFVDARRLDERDPELSGRTVQRVRSLARAVHGRNIELQTPRLHRNLAHFPIHVRAAVPRHHVYAGSAEAFAQGIANALGMGVEELRGRGRERFRTTARRTAVLAWRMAGRQTAEMCAVLAIGASAASNLISRAEDSDVEAAARMLAREVSVRKK
jgi:hypothetical protein